MLAPASSTSCCVLTSAYFSARPGYRGTTATGRQWSLELSFTSSVSNPFGSLVDQDWVSVGSQSIEISHTDSSTTGRAFLADLALRIEVARWLRATRSVSLNVVTGYRHETFLYAQASR